MVRYFWLLTLPFLLVSANADVFDEAAIFKSAVGRFQPSKPAAVMCYDVNYTLAHIRLKRVAGATIKAIEGTWQGLDANERIPAYLIDFQVASPRTGKGSVRLTKRTVCVLSMPDLKIIRYVKKNDEVIKPFFGGERRTNYSEVYDFESGALSYRHYDQLTGAVGSNLVNMADMQTQSKEVADVLQALYAAYQQPSAAGKVCENKVHFNVDGTVMSFELKTRKGRVSVPALPHKIGALFADIQPVKGSDGVSESFSMWCVPFREFAKEKRDPALCQLAEASQTYSMLPLSGEYALFLGSLQCTLTNVCAEVN